MTANSQQTPPTSPSRASYEVSIMKILKKIDRIIMEPHNNGILCYTIHSVKALAIQSEGRLLNGPLTRYAKLRVAHAPGMPGTFSHDAEFKGKRGLAIPACITARASRTCRDACRDCLPAVAGKTFPAFPAHAHPQLYVFGKRPMRHKLSKWSTWYEVTFT